MLNSEEMSVKIAQKVAHHGGRAYYVGGCVRDRLLKKATKDIDIEVHMIHPDALRSILSELGTVNEYGVSFGIFNLSGYDIDIAMPRKEKCTGRGHRDFDIYVDPFLTPEKAALRRDFTVNALMMDVLTGEILDFYGGLKDLEKGVIRHVNDESFAEDPLRVLRACQFCARLGFTLHPSTLELCRSIDIRTLAPERIFGELKKALLSAAKPSVFFELLRRMGKLSPWFSELEDLIGVPQPPKHHPEGDVWTHTMLVLDKAASLKDQARQPLYFMVSALCHDLGKPSTTEVVNGALHSFGHESAGIPIAKGLLDRISGEKDLERYVENMILLHMRPNMLLGVECKPKSFNKLFDQSLCPDDLILLSEADFEGRDESFVYGERRDMLLFRLNEFKELMSRPYVMGRDLIGAGLKPDRNFSKILDHAHKLRISGVEKEIALKDCIAFAKNL